LKQSSWCSSSCAFHGNIRATLIPTIAVPVVLLGPSVAGALGFSINMLTMFAMVLAIGLLVDTPSW